MYSSDNFSRFSPKKRPSAAAIWPIPRSPWIGFFVCLVLFVVKNSLALCSDSWGFRIHWGRVTEMPFVPRRGSIKTISPRNTRNTRKGMQEVGSRSVFGFGFHFVFIFGSNPRVFMVIAGRVEHQLDHKGCGRAGAQPSQVWHARAWSL